MQKIRIAIVDDQNLFRQSLALLIKSVDDFELAAEANSAEAFLERLKTLPADIDVAIIDMDMPGGMNGIELNDILHKQYPNIKVMVLSVHMHERLITQMIDAGAVGYLAKNCDMHELIMSIRSVYIAGFYFNISVLQAIQNSGRHKFSANKTINNLPVNLTDRELQLLKLICKEYSNAEIAKELYLSVRTVEGHRNNLIQKIGCRNTAGIVLFAVKHKLFNTMF
ncbi:response regulator transcription factor [Mucilaginibacter limnophilus]|uniref:Response regulator transcription factor n=1 Tax=Mucilaginibacter limnophilus TaxID=1932778 RepID=A0A437MR79_9SPHI|nr:response regulator transcription factor [Mucilaginibacter limnophilus]RVU00154.1 response regulator transcription factor [Mucilaginibacter limnophilus]